MADERRLRVGVLGCGPIAQAAHFESASKARNAELYAICDVADDLRERMAATYAPQRSFRDYDEMLADPELDAVIVATADAFHVAAATRALEAGKHVLCEKPVGVAVEEVEALKRTVASSGRVLQVGHMKRFDAGIQSARNFIADEMGEMLALKAWYCDSTHRYAMTDAVQPKIIRSKAAMTDCRACPVCFRRRASPSACRNARRAMQACWRGHCCVTWKARVYRGAGPCFRKMATMAAPCERIAEGSAVAGSEPIPYIAH